jgi:hypothetical protein
MTRAAPPIPNRGGVIVPTRQTASLLTIADGRRLRMVVDLRDLDERPLDALRVLLAADVARRVVEDLAGGQAHVAVLEPETAAARARRQVAEAWWIREPAARVNLPDEAPEALGGPVTVAFGPEQWQVPQAWDLPRTLRVGPVCTYRPDVQYPHALDDGDPLTLRLALLRFPYPDRADLSAARIRRAAEILQRWRFKVAGWADMPSAPPADTEEIRTGLVHDLDTSLALRLLHRIEVDPQISSGTKFETFVGLDRVLALDLSHLVGKLRH